MPVNSTLQYLYISRNQAATWERNDERIHLNRGSTSSQDASLALLKPPQFMKFLGNTSVYT